MSDLHNTEFENTEPFRHIVELENQVKALVTAKVKDEQRPQDLNSQRVLDISDGFSILWGSKDEGWLDATLFTDEDVLKEEIYGIRKASFHHRTGGEKNALEGMLKDFWPSNFIGRIHGIDSDTELMIAGDGGDEITYLFDKSGRLAVKIIKTDNEADIKGREVLAQTPVSLLNDKPTTYWVLNRDVEGGEVEQVGAVLDLMVRRMQENSQDSSAP